MAKRKRNEDGSLVTPLSKAQLESLAKGRARLAELAGQGERPAGQGKPAADGNVEHVEFSKEKSSGAKASGRRKTASAKAAGGGRSKAAGRSSSRSKPSPPPRARASSSDDRGAWDRLCDWLGST